MAHYTDQGTGSRGDTDGASAASNPLLRLPVVSQLFRVLEDWQSEFKPRHYDNSYAVVPIERPVARQRSRASSDPLR